MIQTAAPDSAGNTARRLTTANLIQRMTMATFESTSQHSLAAQSSESSDVDSVKARRFLTVSRYFFWEKTRFPECPRPSRVEEPTKRPNPVPNIRLQSRWLEHAGFRPGDKVQIDVVSDGYLTIRRLPAPWQC